MKDNASKASQLKEEGNALFVKHDYAAAYHNYTKAIECDDQNAILYANRRAACSLGMTKYLDATNDARKATNLDPGYAKGWARLAMAYRGIGDFDRSINFWRKASAALPVEGFSAGELKQKEQYANELQSTIAQKEALNRNPTPSFANVRPRDAPWKRAEAMWGELKRNSELSSSSAWVIIGAYRDWIIGTEKMEKMQIHHHGRQATTYVGQMGALAHLSNAVLRDSRIFHVTRNDWKKCITTKNSVKSESESFRAWPEGGSRLVISEAQKRQQNEGWDSVRPAIATTLRAWIMRGFAESNITNRPDIALECFSNALEVLEWGNQNWNDVPTINKGAVFEPTFVRGVRSLHLEAMMKIFTGESVLARDAKYSLSDLLVEAESVVRELDSPLGVPNHSEPVDPGFISSFYVYPKGQAHAMIGFYHNKMAHRCKELNESANVVRDHFRKAAQSYMTAAGIHPEDDEIHVWYLHCGLEALFKCGTPVKELLQVMELIRVAIPKMKVIWEHSAMAQQGRDKLLQRDLFAEEDIRKGIDEGQYTMDDMLTPDIFVK